MDLACAHFSQPFAGAGGRSKSIFGQTTGQLGETMRHLLSRGV